VVAGTARAADGGTPTRWHPARNRFASPLRFEVHPDDLLRIALAIDDAGEDVCGIVHSHLRSPARPSPTDVARAWPGVVHVVVSLDESERDTVTAEPSVRAWWIAGGTATEIALAATPATAPAATPAPVPRVVGS
jgi:proteasome lid subunit RPN8/RPN11